MSVSHSRVVITLALLLPLSAISQDVRPDATPVTIIPSEATPHVGQKQIPFDVLARIPKVLKGTVLSARAQLGSGIALP